MQKIVSIRSPFRRSVGRFLSYSTVGVCVCIGVVVGCRRGGYGTTNVTKNIGWGINMDRGQASVSQRSTRLQQT